MTQDNIMTQKYCNRSRAQTSTMENTKAKAPTTFRLSAGHLTSML
jgi:hypothetical protein